MQLDRLRTAHVPMAPLAVRVTMYRAGAGKYHRASRGCRATKSELHYAPVILTDVADDRYCWSCSHTPPTGTDEHAYYVAAHAVLDALDAHTKRTKTAPKEPLVEVQVARAQLATATRLITAAAHEALTAWAAPHLATLQQAADALADTVPAADDPHLAVRTITVDVLRGAVTLTTDARRVTSRPQPTPNFDPGDYPALCGQKPRWGAGNHRGQDDIIVRSWNVLAHHYLTTGDLPGALETTTAAAHVMLAEQSGPEWLGQVPLDAVPAGATLGEAINTAWRAAATLEVDAIIRELGDLVASTQLAVETSPMRLVGMLHWDDTKAEKVRDAAPLLATWQPTTNPAAALALVRIPTAAVAWLEAKGVVPGTADRVLLLDLGDSPDTDRPETLTLALRLLEGRPASKFQFTDGRATIAEQLTIARAATS